MYITQSRSFFCSVFVASYSLLYYLCSFFLSPSLCYISFLFSFSSLSRPFLAFPASRYFFHSINFGFLFLTFSLVLSTFIFFFAIILLLLLFFLFYFFYAPSSFLAFFTFLGVTFCLQSQCRSL